MERQVEGKSVYIATGGRPFDAASGPVTIFLHGAGMDHTVWALQARSVAHRIGPVLVPDLPGHGRSDGPALDTIEAIADWLMALMDTAGVVRAALVGHSMGALAALEAAGVRAERVWATALLGIATRMPVHPILLTEADSHDHRAAEMVTGWGYGPRGWTGGNIAAGQWMAGAGMRLLEHGLATGAMAAGLTACDRYEMAPIRAPALACPTLFILGAMDRMTPLKGGQALASLAADPTVVALPNTGHMMMIEDPTATTNALLAHLRANRPLP